MEFTYKIQNINSIVKKILNKTNKKIFFMYGDLGSGKTSLVKEFVKQIGSKDKVISPTYNIVNKYKLGNSSIFHLDLYRMKSLDEILYIGIDQYLYSQNYCFIEWPKYLEKWFCKSKISIKIIYYFNFRKIDITF